MGQKQLPCGLETAKHKGPPLQSVVPLRCQKRCAISAIPSRGASSFRNGKQLPLAPGRDSPPLCRIRCRHQGASARPDGRRLTADVFAGSAVVALPFAMPLSRELIPLMGRSCTYIARRSPSTMVFVSSSKSVLWRAEAPPAQSSVSPPRLGQRRTKQSLSHEAPSARRP